MNKRMAFVLALLLFAQLSFPLWTQNVSVAVKDSSGAPAENVDIRITYQKSSGITFGDGEINGKTDAEGRFAATLANSVPAGFSKDYFKVKASAGYWAGEERTLTVSPSKTVAADFTMNVKLEKIAVNVTDLDNRSVGGAIVYLLEVNSQKPTAQNGFAAFMVPEGSNFIGLATYGKTSERFTSAKTHLVGGTRTVDVRLPIAITPRPPSTGVLAMQLQVLGIDMRPVPEKQVFATFRGENSTYVTNSSGQVSFYINESGTLNVSISQYEHDYRNSYPLAVRNNTVQVKSETMVLRPLLVVNSYRFSEESVNCHLIQAFVSDPRSYLPLDVRIFKAVYLADQNLTVNVSLPVSMSDNGAYVTRLCVREQTLTHLVVSNQYETAYRDMNVTYRIPPPPEPDVGPGAKELSTSEIVLSIAAVMIILLVVITFVMGRHYLNIISRFLIEYLRMMIRLMKTKKNEPKEPKSPQ